MTRQESLQALYDAVKGGEVTTNDLRSVFEDGRPGSLDRLVYASRANGGSLDAALALHNAVLPGWEATVAMTGHAGVMFWPTETARNAKVEGQPSRAWLSAILSALIAQEEAP